MASERVVAQNRDEYGDRYSLLQFPSPDQAAAAERRRGEILAAIGDRAVLGCGGSKLDVNRLSPGCAICVAGRWSCLFINGQCNVSCFYCPSRQDEIGEPTTNSVDFRSAGDYVDYVEKFGFTGVSFSGGEPLLTPERTLGYLVAVKKRFGSAIHTWLYTNGTLVTSEILARLCDAGLDEIRFDIGAIGYRLDKAALAVGAIPTVTVEIPAVPEDQALLQEKIAEMAGRGIAHLNLHQLRLTPYNFEKFLGRGYTFLHGEKVTVLESELSALELIRDTLDRGIELPINYCSFVYKNRYQRQAARRRNAQFVIKGWEDLTGAGAIRCLSLVGDADSISLVAENLWQAGVAPEHFTLSRAKDRLSLRAELLSRVGLAGLQARVGYFEANQLSGVTYRNPFVEVGGNPGKKIVIERRPLCAERELSGDALMAWQCLQVGEASRLPDEFERFESLPQGLASYG